MKYSKIALSVALCLPVTFSANAHHDFDGFYPLLKCLITIPTSLAIGVASGFLPLETKQKYCVGIAGGTIGAKYMSDYIDSGPDKILERYKGSLNSACLGAIAGCIGTTAGIVLKELLISSNVDSTLPVEIPSTQTLSIEPPQTSSATLWDTPAGIDDLLC